VLLADDHAIVAEGLARLLRSEFDVLEVVGDGARLVEAARRLRPDVVVADMSMPVLGGLEALRRMRADRPGLRLVFLTQYADAGLAGEAIRAGASGYVLKQSSGDELRTAIREALAGRVYLSPQITGAVVAALAGPAGNHAAGSGGGGGGGGGERLTPRQREVLRLVAEGKTMKEVAAELQLSRRTVEGHKYEMMQQLGVETTAGLIHFAVRHGLAAP
jgi:DNA-binding NarL/FixJ family response regulator